MRTLKRLGLVVMQPLPHGLSSKDEQRLAELANMSIHHFHQTFAFDNLLVIYFRLVFGEVPC